VTIAAAWHVTYTLLVLRTMCNLALAPAVLHKLACSACFETVDVFISIATVGTFWNVVGTIVRTHQGPNLNAIILRAKIVNHKVMCGVIAGSVRRHLAPGVTTIAELMPSPFASRAVAAR
jgi:hypothetical protein